MPIESMSVLERHKVSLRRQLIRGSTPRGGAVIGRKTKGRAQGIGSGGIDGRLIDQENRYFVTHGIDSSALAALQARSVFSLDQRMLTDRTDENVEKISGNHILNLTTFRCPRGQSSSFVKGKAGSWAFLA